jgi:cellobiose-specific phosphotransferase system component IIC
MSNKKNIATNTQQLKVRHIKLIIKNIVLYLIMIICIAVMTYGYISAYKTNGDYARECLISLMVFLIAFINTPIGKKLDKVKNKKDGN